MSNESKKPDLNAYVVTGTDDKPFYTKIGAAWKNKKEGYGLRLDALPVGTFMGLDPTLCDGIIGVVNKLQQGCLPSAD